MLLVSLFANANTSTDQSQDLEKKESSKKENYQFYETRITGNTCGPETDWPCLDADGCLVITKFKK